MMDASHVFQDVFPLCSMSMFARALLLWPGEEGFVCCLASEVLLGTGVSRLDRHHCWGIVIVTPSWQCLLMQKRYALRCVF